MSEQFTARVYRIGIDYCVDVPGAVSEALGGETHIPVAGNAGGAPLRTTLVPRGGGLHRLFLDGDHVEPARLPLVLESRSQRVARQARTAG